MAAKYFPQTAYSGLQRSLQQEWQFLQRVTTNVRDEFLPIRETLRKSFFPSLFADPLSDPLLMDILHLPAKTAGLSLPDPVTSAESNYAASQVICGHLVQALCGQIEFSIFDHIDTIEEGRKELRICRHALAAAKLSSLLECLPSDKSRTIS